MSTITAARTAEAHTIAQLHAVGDALAVIATTDLGAAVQRVRDEALACKARLAAGLADVAGVLADLAGVFADARDLLAADLAAEIGRAAPVVVIEGTVREEKAPEPAVDLAQTAPEVIARIDAETLAAVAATGEPETPSEEMGEPVGIGAAPSANGKEAAHRGPRLGGKRGRGR